MKSNTFLAFVLAVGIQGTGYGQEPADTAGVPSKADSVASASDRGWISVRSDPAGAEVYDGSLLIGVTPIDSVPARTGIHVLRSFYPSARVWNSASTIDTITVLPARAETCLAQFGGSGGQLLLRRYVQSTEKNPNLFLATSDRDDEKTWIAYAVGGTMIISGALSAYLKTSSDTFFNSYLDNRDPNHLARVRRLDRWAGISLFVSELSFGVLTYLLFSE